MKKSVQIFSPLINSIGFLSDINIVGSLEKEEVESAIDVFLKSNYRGFYMSKSKAFSEETQIPRDNVLSVIPVLDFFAYNVVPRYSKEDILEALSDIPINKEAIKNYEFIIDKFKESAIQEKLKILDLIDDEIGTVNPQFRHITFNIQNRIVMMENKIIKKFPIATAEFKTSQSDDTKYKMELLADDIDLMIDQLGKIKKLLVESFID